LNPLGSAAQHEDHWVVRQTKSIEGPVATAATFARSGEYWTISYGTSAFSLKDIKGLSYIQRLLQHPGQEFHALYLLSTEAAGEDSGANRDAILGDAALSIGGAW
jgi:hypothetical protein